MTAGRQGERVWRAEYLFRRELARSGSRADCREDKPAHARYYRQIGQGREQPSNGLSVCCGDQLRDATTWCMGHGVQHLSGGATPSSCTHLAPASVYAGQTVPPAGFEPAAFCSGGSSDPSEGVCSGLPFPLEGMDFVTLTCGKSLYESGAVCSRPPGEFWMSCVSLVSTSTPY